MIQNEIFDKEEFVYFLLYSYSDVNTLIPAKGQVKDIQFHYDNPLYQISLERIYDNIYFIKKHLYNMKFYKKFNQKKTSKLQLDNCSNINEFQAQLNIKDLRVVMPSLMCFSKKQVMLDTFNKLNYYIIMRHLEKLREGMLRTSYTGLLKMAGTLEFNNRFEKFVGDKFDIENSDMTLVDTLFDLERSMPLDGITLPSKNKKKHIRSDKSKLRD